MPGSPYAIQFLPTVPESSGMKPMNVSTYSCRDVSLGCSCGDCPSSPVCSTTAISTSNKGATCSVQIGSLKVRDLLLYYLIFIYFAEWEFLNSYESTFGFLIWAIIQVFLIKYLWWKTAGQMCRFSFGHPLYCIGFYVLRMGHVSPDKKKKPVFSNETIYGYSWGWWISFS